MSSTFIEFVNISIMASWLVLAILFIRILFEKIPKYIYCILWGIVGLRLILPFSIESQLSLIPTTNTIDTTIHHSRPTIQTGIEIVDSNINHYISSNYYEGVTVETNAFESFSSILSIIWILGIILMFLYSVYSYYRIHKKVEASILYKDNIYYCDEIDTPFILGIFKPKIYIPSYLNEKEIIYVLKHEQAHLKRKDHFYKPIGFTLLSIYWFNPILWIAYILLCRDIEAACDEKVIKDMNNNCKKEYSETLFNCSTQRNMILVCPLAFGEVGVKERIKSIINYKKPSFWVIILSVILCIGISIGFLTNPKHNRIIDINDTTTHITLFDNVSSILIPEGRNEICQEDELNSFIQSLLEIKISKNPISQSRDENRSSAHQIRIIHENNYNHITYINFNSDFSEVWIDDGVKPTFSYQVNNSEHMKKLYDETISKKSTVQSFKAVITGFRDDYIIVEPYDNEKEAEKISKYYISTNYYGNTSNSLNLKVQDKVEVVYKW